MAQAGSTDNPGSVTADRRAQRIAIRAAVRAASPVVRKVWLLPHDMVDRILAFQETELLPSEVAAARVLLDRALTRRGF